MNKFKRGYGFRPSDEELIEHLRNRALSGIGCDYSVQEITDLGVDICNWDPWDLPGLTNMVTSTDRTWYFFYPITYKYPECKRRKINDGKRKPLINRATKNGKWKPSGDPRKNKYVLGKLMIQSEPITNKSSSKGQQLPPQVHIDFHDQLDDWVQNQSSISEQPNEFASSSPVDNCTTYPEEIRSNRDNFVNDYQVSQVQLPSNLENYVADDAVLQ
ncbi:No apical meristem (NAM) protein, partial [Corchorus capsularis]